VYVVELGDDEGPRRRADRPNLFVGVTTLDPLEKFERTLAGGRGNAAVRDFGVCIRPDLHLNYPSTPGREDAERQKAKLVRKLSRRGHAVNGDRRIWRVYVVELEDRVGPRVDPNRPWVYVGETSKDPVARLEEHLTGARNGRGRLYSAVVRKHGVRLVPHLYESEPPRYTAADSKVAEADLADRLRAKGYSVRGGH
jgi:hypothetical protein